MNKRALLKIGLIALCAVTMASGFLVSWLWLVSLMGLILGLYLLEHSAKFSRKQFTWYCLLFGYVFFGIVLNWIYKIKTTELIEDTFYAGLFLGLTYFLMVGAFAIGFLVFAVLYRGLGISVKSKTVLFIPALWVIGEYFRSVFFSVFFMGDGGSIGAYWNFGTLGLLASETPLKYAGRVVGLYGLSFLVVLIAISVYKITKKQYRYTWLLSIPLVLSFSGWYFYLESNGKPLDVAVISLGDDTDDGYQDALTSQLSNEGNIDTLVLPEYSNFFVNSEEKQTDHALPENVSLAIDSSSMRRGDEVKNEVNFHNTESELLQSQQKTFLIPGGEYIPYLYHIILYYSGNKSLVHEFHRENAVQQATKAERPFSYKGVSYGSLACSGAIAPQLYTRLVSQGAEVLTNSASIATLGVSDGYYRQARQMATFTAAANARPFLQSARGGPSYILNKDGQSQKGFAQAADVGYLRTTITTNRSKTLYTLWGEWVLYVSVIAACSYGLLQYRQYKGVSKKSKHP